MTYFLRLKKSWDHFKKNLILYIPFVLELIVGLFLVALIIGGEIAILYLLTGTLSGMQSKLLSNPFALAALVLFALIDILVLIMIHSFFRAMKIGMYKEVITGRKTSTAFMFYYAKKFFKKRFEISLILALVFLLPLLLLGVVSGFFLFISKTAGLIIMTICGLAYLLYFIVMGLITYFGLFFIDPVIVSQEKNSLELIGYSLTFARKNISKIIIVWAITLTFSVIISLILYILESPFSVLNIPQYALLTSIFFFIARFAVQTGVNIIEDLFVFDVYFKTK